jgi:hypothetical protein
MNEDLAKGRFNTLNLIRLGGAICAAVGAANIGGRILPDFAPWLGYVMLANGVADVLFIPILLKKKWTKQDQAGQ